MLFPTSLRSGGVPGGVLAGEEGDRSLLICGDLICSGGRQRKHSLLGLGPKFIPPQVIQGGVGGGVHGDEMGGGSRGAVNVFEGVGEGGGGG